MTIPANPKIYHIVPIDRLSSIVSHNCIWCDSEVIKRSLYGISIGINKIKHRRLNEIQLTRHPGLYVGECVPFYFCPRSIMLYVIHQANHEDLPYRRGQEPIVHLEADLYTSVSWATLNNRRWGFTLSNAGAKYVEDRDDISELCEINWGAVQARQWNFEKIREGKQAEFLIEKSFPWHLIERVGVYSKKIYQLAKESIAYNEHRPRVEIIPTWYY